MNPGNSTSLLYRVTYEAYSNFANSINRCTSIQEVGEVSKRHLKYLLNFHIIRVSLQQKDKFLFFSVCGNEVFSELKEESALLPHERELFKKGIPMNTKDIPKDLLEGKLNPKKMSSPQLWAWLFKKNERKVMVSLVSDENKPFKTADVDILKLAVDCFEAKFHEIDLKRQLDKRNSSLTEALKTIQSQNERIQKIVDNQKETIKERTREITEKNEKLFHISALNAHNVREPLSRIQGIIQLFESFDDETCRKELIPKLEASAREMDEVLQEVILMATQELTHLKAKEI